MRIEFDPDKDARNLALRNISLAAAEELLRGFTIQWLDTRRNYGEVRSIAIGEINGVEFCCVYTLRGEVTRVISLRRAKRRERHVYQKAKAERDPA